MSVKAPGIGRTSRSEPWVLNSSGVSLIGETGYRTPYINASGKDSLLTAIINIGQRKQQTRTDTDCSAVGHAAAVTHTGLATPRYPVIP